jgi:hypothetical protein
MVNRMPHLLGIARLRPFHGPCSTHIMPSAPGWVSRPLCGRTNLLGSQRTGPTTWSPQVGFAHRLDNHYGENLYSISGGTSSPEQVVGYWADEARGYDIRNNTCAGVCGHYTQIVWGKTRTVGCAVATDRRREVWVCNYDPPGNVVGYRPY